MRTRRPEKNKTKKPGKKKEKEAYNGSHQSEEGKRTAPAPKVSLGESERGERLKKQKLPMKK